MEKDKKLKVLLCSPSNIINCGISRWTNHILEYYKTIQSSIDLVHYYPLLAGVYNDTPTYKRLWLGITGYLPFLVNLYKMLKIGKFDILHFISSGSLALLRDILTIKLAKKYNVASIVHFRFGRIPEILLSKNWEYKLLNQVIKSVDKVVVIDQSSYDALLKYGYKNIYLLPNPLAPKIQNIINQNKHIIRENRKVVFAGHVVPTKGIYELMHAFNSISNITLKILGYVSETMKEELFSLVDKEKSKFLEIVGEQSHDAIIKEMLSAGVFVLPTYTEGFPNVILESMACACPIVTTNVGAIPEMLDVKNGFNNGIVIEPKDTDQLINAINKMLNDREYALNCGNNAQIRVNEFYSMDSVWYQLNNIWNNKI